MSPFFLDTSYLVALINPRDQLHRNAIDLQAEIGNTQLITTESILVETLNFFSAFRTEAKQHAFATVEDLLLNPKIVVVEQTSSIFHDGLEFYSQRLDKGYSLTDCISMLVMKQFNASEILTHDEHFSQEGFHILL